jgi:triphosphoribosyl-dephospho-CoA synthase
MPGSSSRVPPPPPGRSARPAQPWANGSKRRWAPPGRPPAATPTWASDAADARAAYRAIALVRPGGLGQAPEQDVREPPTVGLREAMALAAHRDRIAWQYLHGYPDVFELGLPAFLSAHGAGAAAASAMQAAFLEFVAALPDSHIVRKHGDDVAHCVIGEALPWRTRARRGELLDGHAAFAGWDEELKARGVNPGTSADLCVAVALAAMLSGRTQRFY